MSVLSIGAVILATVAGLFVLGVLAGLFWVAWKLLRVVFWLIGHTLGFAKSEVVDTLHTAGALVTAFATVPLAAVNFTILRFGAGRHYARAFVDELRGVGVGLWRVALGNPLRFVGLGTVVDRVEQRLPDVMERAPRARRARRATFDGYDVVGTLPSGGSGAQLFVARPRAATHKRFMKAGRALPSEVVIKSFALEAGSTLPQIVRESRALEAASRLGLVCEHQLTNDHFFYVMPYVKGEDLDRVIRALHARGTAEGLADTELGLALGYAIDLCDALQRFHSGGLWHKDVKPANVIVASGRAHLVDFGLVTPLASALTLTTHGTEYYRDPEMVRLAMQGVKVHEVDGVRFDVYSAGAVLYSLIENSFPAHGNLSRIGKRCPEALRWIVQRAMAEMSSRYPSAAEMRADLAALAAAPEPFEVRPADLPSFQRASAQPSPAAAREPGFAPFPAMPAAGPSREPFTFRPASVPAGSERFGPRRRRRFGRPLALAACLFGFVCLANVGFLRAARARAHEVAAIETRARSIPPPKRPWSSLSARDKKLVDLAEGVAKDLGDDPDASAAPAVVVPPSRGERESAAHEAPAGPESGLLPPHGRVLVLDDLTTDVDERVLALLRSRLGSRGFRVVGEEGDEAAAAAAVELLAGARHALGLGRADEPDTQASLQRFLDQTLELDALILVSRGEKESEHLYRVFVKAPVLAAGAGNERR
jgi:serine/threonine protein kinase